MFDNARLEVCDLGRAALERTTWSGAKVVRCSFVGATLTDSNLDHPPSSTAICMALICGWSISAARRPP
ncbi:MAG TPA: pentapeptide repeat-containing protein [Kofleriaceae bacterium]|nr:pentapeptide repeat-containing protein [Kofleriaceae bacterium]